MKHKYFYLTLLITFLVDQLSKYLALIYLSKLSTFPILKNIFHLTLVKNKGAAFGLFHNQTSFLIIVAILVFIIIFFFRSIFIHGRLSEVGIGLLLGGNLGNLFDRLTRGHVIDFFDMRVWPVFNISDIAIDIGVAFIIYEMFLGKNKDASNTS